MTKLDPESVMTIKKLHARGVPGTAIARMLGVCEGTVRYRRRSAFRAERNRFAVAEDRDVLGTRMVVAAVADGLRDFRIAARVSR